MPETMIAEWISTDRVGFDGQSGLVKILVEKILSASIIRWKIKATIIPIRI
jgi:hypothetical protein